MFYVNFLFRFLIVVNLNAFAKNLKILFDSPLSMITIICFLLRLIFTSGRQLW